MNSYAVSILWKLDFSVLNYRDTVEIVENSFFFSQFCC